VEPTANSVHCAPAVGGGSPRAFAAKGNRMPPSPDVIDYLEKDFLAAINNDLIAVLKFHEGGVGGFHSIPREVFCYIDYISAIDMAKIARRMQFALLKSILVVQTFDTNTSGNFSMKCGAMGRSTNSIQSD
jgi:hypothetical protein